MQDVNQNLFTGFWFDLGITKDKLSENISSDSKLKKSFDYFIIRSSRAYLNRVRHN